MLIFPETNDIFAANNPKGSGKKLLKLGSGLLSRELNDIFFQGLPVSFNKV